MKLIHVKTGKEAKVGDAVKSFRGREAKIVSFEKPHKPSSEGYVNVIDEDNNKLTYYAGVYGLKWIDREDRS